MESFNGKKFALCVLSFLIPIIGWILYFVKRDNDLDEAKSYANWAWIGFGVALIYSFVL